MLTIAIVCFLVAALGGIVMALRVFRGELPQPAVAAAHGVAGALGLVLVLVAVLQGTGGSLAAAALAVLVVAALGGFYLLRFHLKGQTHPRPVVVVHALAAVAGVVLLLAAVFL